jgi:two-component system NtrC family sensor kinase
VKAPALGEAATHLPWLAPGAASLVALGRLSAAEAWLEVRSDPGALLLVVRHGPAAAAKCFFPALLHEPAILEAAARLVELPGHGFVDWQQPAVRPVYEAAVAYASLARDFAVRGGRCDPDQAWVAGLLAPLGWLAVCAVDPVGAAACLADPEMPHDPGRVQRQRWGFDQAAIARRLSRRWRLPRWLAVVVGHLDLPPETAATLGADPEVFRVAQLALTQAQRQGAGLHLAVGSGQWPVSSEQGHQELGAPEPAAASLPSSLPTAHGPLPTDWADPRATPLLRDFLALAAENRRLQHAPVLEHLESDVDQLHHALEDQRLRGRKLSALAELAAGAGHEINNPLAVISGQAQYLLNHEMELGRKQALQAIISQAQRIHQILSDLMQFARPVRPHKQAVDMPNLVRDVTASLSELAAQRQVHLVCPAAEQPLSVYADPRQVHTALACLVRNAIEAAPTEGWASVRLETPTPDRLDLVIEDNGSGPGPRDREHLFDPFYSGRQAGRGRGLGLSTAWRLAREHGGDVRFEDLPDGPTRFVLSLPRQNGSNGSK